LAKKLLKIAMWGMIVFLTAYTIAYYKFNDEVLGAFISKSVNAVERGTFTLKVAHFDYWSGLASVLLDTRAHAVGLDYELKDPDGATVLKVPICETDVYLQELVVSLAKYALTRNFTLNLHFVDARVPRGFAVIAPTRSSWGSEKPEVNLVAAMSGKKVGPPGPGELRITVDSVTLENIDFGLGFPNRDGKLAWSGRFVDAQGQAALVYSSRTGLETRDGPYFFFKVHDLASASAELRMGAFTFPLEKLALAEFGPNGDRRQDIVYRATTNVFGAAVQVAGALTDCYGKAHDAGVRMKLSFQHAGGLMTMLPKPLPDWISGDPEGELTFLGPFAHVVIDGMVKNATANVQGLKIAKLESKLHLDGELLTLEPTGEVAGGRASATTEVGLERLPWWRARLVVKHVDPALIPHIPPELRTALAGRLDASLRIGGSLVAKDVDTIYAQAIDATLERTNPGRLPRRVVLTGALDWAPTRVQLKNLQAAGEGLEVAANGEVDPRDGRLSTSVRVDSGKGAAWLAHLGAPKGLELGHAHAEGTLRGTLGRPAFTAHLTADGSSFHARTIDHFAADLSLAAGTLKAENLTGDGLGATFHGDGELELFENGDVLKPRADPPLALHVTAKGVSVRAATGWNGIEGDADVALDIEGPISDPRGHASIELPQLTIRDDPYERGKLAIAFGDGGAAIQKLHLERRGGGTLTGSGRVRWDGGLELALKPHDFPLAAIPGISGLPVALAGKLSGDVDVTGDADHPDIGGGINLFGFKVREVPLGDGSLKLIPGADAIAIKGNLFGKVEVDGYLTLFPKFTVAGTLTFKDVALEKILPEMKKLAEVSGTASGQARITFDGQSGLTFAGLTLDKLSLAFSGTEADGRKRSVVVRNQDPVKLSTDGTVLRIDRCHMVSPQFDFYVLGQVSEKDSNVHLHGDIDLVLAEYFFRGAFEHTHGKSNLDLTIQGDLARPKLAGFLNMTNAELQPRGLEHLLSVPSGRILFAEDKMTLSNLSLVMDGQLARASGWVELKQWVPNHIAGDVSGDLSPRLLQWLAKDYVAEASGRVSVSVHLGGLWTAPEWAGNAEIKGARGKLRNWPHDLAIQSGTLRFINSDILLGCPKSRGLPGCKSVAGGIDGNPLSIDGAVTIGGPTMLKSIDLALDGTELRQEVNGEWAITFSPHVTIHGGGDHLTASGTVDLTEGRYRQDFDFINQVVLRPRTVEKQVPFWTGYAMLETMTLDLHAQGGSLIIKNNIADLQMSANLEITGTLSEPRLNGNIHVEEGGKFTIPGFRVAFDSDSGNINFDPEKRIPDETPTLDVGGSGLFIDPRDDSSHTLFLRLFGTIGNLQPKLWSAEGWDQVTVLSVLVTGQTPEQLRRLGLSDPSGRSGAGGASASEGAIKTITGYGVGQVVAAPLQQWLKLDSTVVEFGANSFDVKLCKRFTRHLNTCGYGEVGFTTSSKVEGRLELRVSDWVSAQGKVEYLTQGVDTSQDALTRGKLELKLQIPLGY
jgi:autotransporter translocation and assembly factor TamB